MNIKNMCMDTGGRLAAIDSREKEDYFKHILCKVTFFLLHISDFDSKIMHFT